MSGTYLGNSLLPEEDAVVEGDFVTRDGERYFRIKNYDRMPPFLMAVVSGYDHWMFISSTGGLTCGRGSPENAIFPYYTDDKIHDACFTTGPKTLLRVSMGDETKLWTPFQPGLKHYRVERNLYKNLVGNRLLFEEVNHDLGISFSYTWSSGDRFGFIRHARLQNVGDEMVDIEFLDGLRNLLPAGVASQLQNDRSTLLDAYKQGEALDERTALFSMSSIPTDRAEPSEALKATVVWTSGLENPLPLLTEDQVEAFCLGAAVHSEALSRGRRCAFFQKASTVLEPGSDASWYTVASTGQGPSEIARLLDDLARGVDTRWIEDDIAAGQQRLVEMAGGADAFQLSGDERDSARHFSNTLFNIMRGGVFYDGYRFPRDDFLAFVEQWNRPLGEQLKGQWASAGAECSRDDILQAAAGHTGLERLALEYLPLTFSRRHGDPSRPWNQFSIDIRDEHGAARLNYQGNWRDIFQNWEALSFSYPEYITSFITKFVNASSPDGYNPYRIGRDGFNWEVHDPDDPWSNIGYWGDHQVNYLLKLLELSVKYHPGQLEQYLSRDLFVYADIPYRISGYKDLLRDPRASVAYDFEAAKRVEQRVAMLGSDGRLLARSDGSLHQVNLLEKLLLTVLAKLGNFVPDGGIWMNTQRPEWNDANNALAGYGLSMVTLCYLRRLLVLLDGILVVDTSETYPVSEEVAGYLAAVHAVLSGHRALSGSPIDDAGRKLIVDGLGEASEDYRNRVYSGVSGDRQKVSKSEVLELLSTAMTWLDASILHNQRADGLFHSYNLIHIGEDGFGVEHLDEMLEGQVAVLNSGFLDEGESLGLLEALRASKLYRADKNSYLLYPDRQLPSYTEKNIIPKDVVASSAFLQHELDSGRRDFVEQDVNGRVHFNGRFRNVETLREVLAADDSVAAQDGENLCEIWESVFQHRRFTGRSGAMYKYEGLGCIYWHMVSKLLLVAGETVMQAGESGADPAVFTSLLERYREIEDGIGVHSNPAEYGAFPTDPYSHTTGFSGVQQPGMTGQVKEDILSRFMELGVIVDKGEICFRPLMLRREEFIPDAAVWQFPAKGDETEVRLEPNSLAFSLCGVPVVYRLSEAQEIRVFEKAGNISRLPGNCLGAKLSRSLFRRDEVIERLEVDILADTLN